MARKQKHYSASARTSQTHKTKKPKTKKKRTQNKNGSPVCFALHLRDRFNARLKLNIARVRGSNVWRTFISGRGEWIPNWRITISTHTNENEELCSFLPWFTVAPAALCFFFFDSLLGYTKKGEKMMDIMDEPFSRFFLIEKYIDTRQRIDFNLLVFRLHSC